MRSLIFIVSALSVFFIPVRVTGQNSQKYTDCTFMFLNTENFFDNENDPLTNDEEFTPEGDRHWTGGKFYAKAERIGKVIVAAGKWNAPVFVGLCEIENLKVLQLLTGVAPLKKYNYQIIQKDSPDERGIDVALIYRPELFAPFDYEAIPVTDPNDKSFRTRDILRVSAVFNGCDTLHVFVNHWPSRYGGIMETVPRRKLAAERLKSAIAELKRLYPKPKIICVGDFNDSPKDESVAKTLGAKSEMSAESTGELVNLSYSWMSRSVQTIKSQYSWDVFDQIIVSDSFLQSGKCYEYNSAEIFDASFLLEPDAKFGGVRPKRTFVGLKYQEGFSDHLPVLLKVSLK